MNHTCVHLLNTFIYKCLFTNAYLQIIIFNDDKSTHKPVY